MKIILRLADRDQTKLGHARIGIDHHSSFAPKPLSQFAAPAKPPFP
jgi:hypothetical protein